jgi:hypothetical protein
MNADVLVERILDDEGLTGDLEEAEATLLVQELLRRTKQIAAGIEDAQAARAAVEKLCLRGRKVAAVVAMFRDKGESAARLLANRESLLWPDAVTDSPDLLRRLMTN